MKFFKVFLFIILTNSVCINVTAQNIQVDDTYSAQQLLEDVLINSTCAQVSNFSSSGDNYSNGEQSFGYFSSVSNNFPFNDGIVLSTSRAKRTEGPNDNLIDEGSTSWLGDQDLEKALDITNTINATILEFDFIPQTNAISFDYIFASEEYQGSAPCKYSDGFAFLLKEAGTNDPYKNLAVLPNTNTPVLVTTVHPIISSGCPAINEQYFAGYNQTNAPINFNGQTVVLTAKSSVIAGKKYHIKLVIADHENIRYDSAIFLSGGSFTSGTDLGPDQLLATQNPICEGNSRLLDATQPGNNQYVWYKDNVEIIGESQPTYNVTQKGVYTVAVRLGSSTCISKGEVTIEYVPLPVLNSAILVQCDEDKNGKTIFNLAKADAIIKGTDASLGTVFYYETLTDAQSQEVSKSIVNFTNYESSPKTIFAIIANAYGCASITQLELKISNNSSANIDFERCDVDGQIDGFFTFTLSEANAFLLQGLPIGLMAEYYETINDALLQTNVLPNSYKNKTIYTSNIYARIINGADCFGISIVTLQVTANEPPDFEDENVSFCQNDSKRLEVGAYFSSYLWSNGDTNYYTLIDQPGEYTVTVSDGNTCLATKKFIVTASEIPKITSVTINNFQINNTVLINYTGIGEHQFSLDGINFQDSPYFDNVSSKVYTAIVKNDCGLDEKGIYVLNYPRLFTPNGDSYNDVWEIENFNQFAYFKVRIFDKYGKFIYEFNNKSKGWDGKLNGQNLPSADYWFVITLEDATTFKGHFSLKR